MPYKFLSAEKEIQTSPKMEYVGFLQQTVNEQFYNASDWFTVQEETSFASGEFRDLDVRINGVVDTQTGERVGDDFRKLIFKDFNYVTQLGALYKFADNYWIVVNRDDTMHLLVVSVTVKRCNNMLRWVDDDGSLHEHPCSISYLIKENRDYSTAGSALVVPSGMVEAQVQMNPETRKIKPNQRFLFGNSDNWTGYRVEGGGIRNYNNTMTLDNSSAGLMLLSLAVDYVNQQTDDTTNGIADVNQFVYTLHLNQSSISGSTGQSVQLEAIVELNNKIVSRSVSWSSDKKNIAEVDENGLVTFVANGTATITCHLLGNSGISDTCDVTVISSPVDNYQVIFSPSKNIILENTEQTWTVYLYKNGVQQADTFSFALDPNSVPDSKYVYEVVGGNSFKIHNYGRFLEDSLEVTATSGLHSETLNILLRGSW